MKPLLRRSNLLPGESLPSLLERLSRLNYYNTGTISWLFHSNKSDQCRIDITQPNSPQAFFQLAQLTLIRPEDLLAASKHFFAPLLYSPENTKIFMRWFDGKNIQLLSSNIAYRKIRPHHAAQFCPICLKESPYHRLAWMPISSAICLQHKCLLLDQCPICLKNVTIAEIVAHQCKVCKTDLAQIPPVCAIDYNELGILSQRVIQSWLSLVPTPSLNKTLPECSSVMHLLWERLRMSLLTCQIDWRNLQIPLAGLHLYIPNTLNLRKRLPPKYAYYLYSKTFTGILNWPQGFYDLLDAYGQRNFNVRWSRNIAVRLGSLGEWFCKILGQPEFIPLHPVLQEYISARYLSLPISCQILNI